MRLGLGPWLSYRELSHDCRDVVLHDQTWSSPRPGVRRGIHTPVVGVQLRTEQHEAGMRVLPGSCGLLQTVFRAARLAVTMMALGRREPLCSEIWTWCGQSC